MPRYAYKAKNGPDKTVEGELVAESHSAAISRIDAMGYTPIWVKETHATERSARGFSLRGVTRGDVNIFTRQLSSLLRAGVPILRSLRTIGEQTSSGRMRGVVADLERSVRDGRMLSEAMVGYPTLFPPLYLNMIKSGESGGVMDEILLRLVEVREQEEEIVSKVRSAVAYPLFILGVGVITIFLMVAVFLPRIARIFENGHTLLPLPTRVLMSISGFVSDYWYWILGIGILAGAIIRQTATSNLGRGVWDRMVLRIPVLGTFLHEADMERFARTLSLLIRTAIPIDRAIELSGKTLQNSALREDVEQVKRGTVQRGQTIAAGLRQTRYFPSFVSNMVAVGEEGGRLDESLTEVAAFYQRQLDRRIKMVTSLLEPILILVIGSIVGFIIFAMLLPIFQIGQVIS